MKEPIRVLHVVQRMEAGGTQALLMNLYRNIDRSKVQFDFLVEYPNKQFYDDEIKKLGGRIYYTNVRNDYNIFKFEKKIEEIFKSNLNYRIIHVHAYTIGYFVLKIAKKCGIPIRIAHSHNNETIHDVKIFYKKIMQFLFSFNATDLFACSKEAGEYLFKKRKFNILNNAIDTKKFIFNNDIRNEIREKLNIKDNLVVGHVGRMHKQKNHTFLIEIFEQIKKVNKNAKLVLVGTGPLENEIKNIIIKKNLEKDVILLKNIKDVNRIYMAMDVFVFPSLFEGLGIVAIEAQATGLPSLLSDKLPRESFITPLANKISLEKTSKYWAETAIEISKKNIKRENMEKYIKAANYDVVESAKFMQNYYLESINRIK